MFGCKIIILPIFIYKQNIRKGVHGGFGHPTECADFPNIIKDFLYCNLMTVDLNLKMQEYRKVENASAKGCLRKYI